MRLPIEEIRRLLDETYISVEAGFVGYRPKQIKEHHDNSILVLHEALRLVAECEDAYKAALELEVQESAEREEAE